MCQEKNSYLNDNTGCRSDLVRLNNEVDYLLFGKLHANNVVIGRNYYLYEQPYIEEYYGADFIGTDVIRNILVKLKKVQDTLERLGKTFVFMHAGSKAWYFPDNFPPNPVPEERKKPNTNYKTFRHIADSIGIKQIDCNGWFMAMKDTTKHLLFSSLGTHWTGYASLLTADSLIKYIEKQRNIRMPELVWKTIVYDDNPHLYDDDLDQGLNRMFHFKKERFSYPLYSYNCEGQIIKPSAIYIGDSFLWVWLSNGVMQSINKDWQVWFYFNSVVTGKSADLEQSKEISLINSQNEMLNTDCIVMLYTPMNFKGFNNSSSFIEQAYRYFYPNDKK